ncbi:MAG: RHS repeat-associated core domain-containing protein [Candidatus Eremiobacteraeota bacterium]|nr:RHS repeat-associated core domain-containing protein [Candidatus Eremiobacteraeota bacterium]MCW5869372.1 RHS repeat-associated core domain-containing protein [Candidatus Eremiobacteraeota bacterium]
MEAPSGGLVASFTKTDGSTGWDANGQLLCLRYLKSGVHFHRFEYSYDDSGNRISLIDTPDAGGATTWSYGYDYLNRLTSVTRGSSTTLYAYDESDNRMSLTLPNGDVWTYGYDLADQIASRSFTPFGGSPAVVESYSHDHDGNMIARTQSGVTTTYDWNDFNRLRQVAVGGTPVETTSYDHEGIRRLKVDGAGASKSFSSGAMSLCDTRPSGPVSFVQGHQLLGLEQGGNLYFLISDGLSSVRKVVNSSGVSQGEFKFDEFGVPESSTTPPADLSAHSYVGGLGQRNEGGGLYYARQRWYDANLARWLSQDPIGFSGGLNLFGYTGQSPTNWVDPSGLDPIWIGTGEKIKVSHDICGTRTDVTYDDSVTILELKTAYENTSDLMVLFAHNWASFEGVHLEGGTLRLEQLRAWKRRPKILFLAGCRTDDNAGIGRMETPRGMATITLKNVTEMKHIRRFLRPFIRNLEAGQSVQEASDNALSGIRNTKAAEALRGTIQIQGGNVRL